MSALDEARKLLGLAERDLARMEAVHTNKNLDDEAYGFFAQQAVEKSLKAVLTVQGTAFSYTHDLVRLFDLLPAGDPRLALEADLTPLFPYAVEFRYDLSQLAPALDRDATRDSIQRLIALVKVDVP